VPVHTYVPARPLFSCHLRYEVINCATSNGEIRKAEARSLSDRDTSRRVASRRLASRVSREEICLMAAAAAAAAAAVIYVGINDASGKAS